MPKTPNGRYAMASHSRAWEEFYAEELEDYFEEPEPEVEEDDEDWADAQVVRWPR